MRTLAPPRLLAARSLHVFLAQWPLALAGEAEAIHQARVATRRVREVLPLVATRPGERDVRRLRRAFRDLGRALGPSRELDVSLAILERMAATGTGWTDPVRATRALVRHERARAAVVLADTGATIDVAVIGEQVLALAARINSADAMTRAAQRAADRLAARALAIDHAALRAGRVYASGPLHGVRISLKQFRYALEVAAFVGRFRLGATLRRLKQLQDVLGDMHDLQILSAHVRDAGAGVAAIRRPGVARFADHLDERIRALHSEYVDLRSVLVPVLARAEAVRRALRLEPPPAASRRPRPVRP
jgi:CHAD domain-containing protein